MAIRLDPSTSAVVTMECQRGVVGDLATFPALAAAATEVGLVERLAALVSAARAAGVPVVHALAHFRADRVGSPTNAPLLRAAARIEGQLLEGSPAAEVVPEIWADRDATSARHHGVSPFGCTDLDPLLRSLGVGTVVACGASLNVGVLGLCIEAVNLGYEVVVVRDATVAVPPSYAAAVLAGTVAQLARLATVAEVASAWSSAEG